MPVIEFEIWCSCGEGLCNQSKETKGGVIVEPCEKCKERSRDEGYDDGYSKGYDDAEKEAL